MQASGFEAGADRDAGEREAGSGWAEEGREDGVASDAMHDSEGIWVAGEAALE